MQESGDPLTLRVATAAPVSAARTRRWPSDEPAANATPNGWKAMQIHSKPTWTYNVSFENLFLVISEFNFLQFIFLFWIKNICAKKWIVSRDLCRPEKLVPSPESDILVVAGSGEDLVVRMHGESPELPAMTENNLVESPLQRALEDVVSRRAHVDVTVVSTWSLRINTSYTARGFW